LQKNGEQRDDSIDEWIAALIAGAGELGLATDALELLCRECEQRTRARNMWPNRFNLDGLR
jgi:hypothetical protein